MEEKKEDKVTMKVKIMERKGNDKSCCIEDFLGKTL